MNIANLGVGMILAFVYGWAIALVILAFIPFIIVSGVLQTKLLTGFSKKDKEVLEDAGKVRKFFKVFQIISNFKNDILFRLQMRQ